MEAVDPDEAGPWRDDPRFDNRRGRRDTNEDAASRRRAG